jgi:hypothetical protein
VRGHVLTMVTEADDAFGLALLGLRDHATTAALGASASSPRPSPGHGGCSRVPSDGTVKDFTAWSEDA